MSKVMKPERILITRSDRMGDLVLSTPVFSAVRKKFPQAWIAALAFTENRDLLEGNPDLDEVLLYDKKGSEKSWLGNLFFARQLAKKQFDVVIHLHATNRMHWLGWLARIPCRIGWDHKLKWTLTHAYPDIKKEGKKHEAQYNFELLKLWGIEAPRSLELQVSQDPSKAKSLEMLLRHYGISADRPIIAIHPSASCPSKRWPALYFAKLMDLIKAEFDVDFVLVGSRSERSLIQDVQRQMKTSAIDLSGRLSLGMLAILLKRSALLISNDSGPVHVASAVGTAVISIFGRKQAGLSHVRWGPVTSHSRVAWKDVGCEVCLAHRCRINFLCLEALLPEEVFEQTKPFLSPLKRVMHAAP